MIHIRRRAACLALLMLTSALLTTSCGSLVAPFQGVPDVPRGVSDPGDRIAVCYNSQFSTPAQVHAVAVDACGPDTTPQLLRQDEHLNCPLLTPVRATYQCVQE
ncbi:MAG: hypothetical protein JO255_10945 [Alphaproteobacteria bacterium]|nr:hypothetical protein [Alphaproteobacteria bacterium]